jgi:hypothetical protein
MTTRGLLMSAGAMDAGDLLRQQTAGSVYVDFDYLGGRRAAALTQPCCSIQPHFGRAAPAKSHGDHHLYSIRRACCPSSLSRRKRICPQASGKRPSIWKKAKVARSAGGPGLRSVCRNTCRG